MQALTAPEGPFFQQKVKFVAVNYFKCECSICVKQIKIGHTFDIIIKKDMSLYENQKVIYSYQNIVEMMISPNPELESCDILLTDTLFIGEDGQLLFWAKTDKGKVS